MVVEVLRVDSLWSASCCWWLLLGVEMMDWRFGGKDHRHRQETETIRSSVFFIGHKSPTRNHSTRPCHPSYPLTIPVPRSRSSIWSGVARANHLPVWCQPWGINTLTIPQEPDKPPTRPRCRQPSALALKRTPGFMSPWGSSFLSLCQPKQSSQQTPQSSPRAMFTLSSMSSRGAGKLIRHGAGKGIKKAHQRLIRSWVKHVHGYGIISINRRPKAWRRKSGMDAIYCAYEEELLTTDITIQTAHLHPASLCPDHHSFK